MYENTQHPDAQTQNPEILFNYNKITITIATLRFNQRCTRLDAGSPEIEAKFLSDSKHQSLMDRSLMTCRLVAIFRASREPGKSQRTSRRTMHTMIRAGCWILDRERCGWSRTEL
ncbi:hypothetical protein KQX54_016009 [Cotesia glomerata]|uniref:Uncharacterized protein n=1 Tax=Cotesia glomerata TaxID=32391 RepID=A0AAV7IRF8_COTGL|nr:hypothetical protein KQX54_016009 [Cotesia glomerata]